jgi:hypothetical protein
VIEGTGSDIRPLEVTGSDIRPLESSNHGFQVIGLLKQRFSEDNAAKIYSKLGIVKTEDLVEFSESDINGLGLMDPHRKILLQLVNVAKIYQKTVAGAVSLKENDLNDSYLSGAETSSNISDSEDDMDCNFDSLAIRYSGDTEDFQEHMRGFIQTFLDCQSGIRTCTCVHP